MTLISTTEGICIAAFANEKWKREGREVRDRIKKDSECMLLNLTNEYSVKARDHLWGGIYCSSYHGPSFGNYELFTAEPLLREGHVTSRIGGEGFMIGGKVNDINPLTGDTIVKPEVWSPRSISTALEIEVWQIEIESECSIF